MPIVGVLEAFVLPYLARIDEFDVVTGLGEPIDEPVPVERVREIFL